MGAVFALSPAGRVSASNIVNLSHYDVPVPDFAAMKREGVVGIIHEATYPPGTGDPKYGGRQAAAVRAGLLWGAYHFGNASNPIKQADGFINFVAAQRRESSASPAGVLMVLDFEQNTHYPGGTMTVAQAAAFVERIKERTGQYPGLYSNENRIRSVLNGSGIDPLDKRSLSKCWLWVANYHHKPGPMTPWSRWSMWQYTGDGVCDLPRGSYPIHVANIRNAERNLFASGQGDLASFWRSHSWQPGG